jgi:uncharacterized protein YcbX
MIVKGFHRLVQNDSPRSMIHLGRIKELARYPVKSMAGVPMDSAFLGWHGFPGDRRFAFRRLDDSGGFPFLSASRLPDLILYRPAGEEEGAAEPTPTHVTTPDGATLPLRSVELRDRIAGQLGSSVELMQFKHGIFDDACVSVIDIATISAICEEGGQKPDTRRFRANVVLETNSAQAFREDDWVGGRLAFGDPETGPMVSVTARDVRCMMINLDPDTAQQHPQLMKTVVRRNDNNAGVYGTVIRTGHVAVGEPVTLLPS